MDNTCTIKMVLDLVLLALLLTLSPVSMESVHDTCTKDLEKYTYDDLFIMLGDLSNKLRNRFTYFDFEESDTLKNVISVLQGKPTKRLEQCWKYILLYHDSVFLTFEEHLFKATRMAYQHIIKMRTILFHFSLSSSQKATLKTSLKNLRILLKVAKRPLPDLGIDPCHSSSDHCNRTKLKMLARCRAYMSTQWDEYENLYDMFSDNFVAFPEDFVEDVNCIHDLFIKLEAKGSSNRFVQPHSASIAIEVCEQAEDLVADLVKESNKLDTSLHQIHFGLNVIENKEPKQVELNIYHACKPVLKLLDQFYHFGHKINFKKNRMLLNQLNLIVILQTELNTQHSDAAKQIVLGYRSQIYKFLNNPNITNNVKSLTALFDGGRLNDIECYTQLAGSAVSPLDAMKLYQLLQKLTRNENQDERMIKIAKLVETEEFGHVYEQLEPLFDSSFEAFPTTSLEERREDLTGRGTSASDVFDLSLKTNGTVSNEKYDYIIVGGVLVPVFVIVLLVICCLRKHLSLWESEIDLGPTTNPIPLAPIVPPPRHIRPSSLVTPVIESWL